MPESCPIRFLTPAEEWEALIREIEIKAKRKQVLIVALERLEHTQRELVELLR